jgi:hypothetical protein
MTSPNINESIQPKHEIQRRQCWPRPYRSVTHKTPSQNPNQAMEPSGGLVPTKEAGPFDLLTSNRSPMYPSKPPTK